MTLETTVSKAVYTGNGATTEFPFSFKVWDEKQILVSVTDAQGYVQEVGEYSVTLSAGGGTVFYLHDGAPLPSGWKLAITRDMPFTQEDDYITGTRFDPEVIETALDKATAERQQLREQLQRAVILPPTSDETPEDMAQELLRARDEAVKSAGTAKNSEQAAADSASDAAASEQAAAESVRQAEDWTERAQAWAESPTPPDPDDPESKSAKEWAKIASDTVPIATPALAGKVMPQTGDEDGLELETDGKLRVRKATASQRGSVLASETALEGAAPLGGEDGSLDERWLKKAMEAADKAQQTADIYASLVLKASRTSAGQFTVTDCDPNRLLYLSFEDGTGRAGLIIKCKEGTASFDMDLVLGIVSESSRNYVVPVKITNAHPIFDITTWTIQSGWSLRCYQ